MSNLSMGNLLFSSTGRIGPQDFKKGAVILLALNYFLWLSWYISLGIGTLVGCAALLSIYCWACLFVKRFHDANKSGGAFALLFIAFLLLAMVIGDIILTGLGRPHPSNT